MLQGRRPGMPIKYFERLALELGSVPLHDGYNQQQKDVPAPHEDDLQDRLLLFACLASRQGRLGFLLVQWQAQCNDGRPPYNAPQSTYVERHL